MNVECKKLVEAYVNWLKEKITVADVDGACEITTPFLDRHNDCLQIYVQKTAHGLRLTDDGYTVADLELSGCSLETESRQHMVKTILNGFGVSLAEDGELFLEASEETFPQKKHALVQAMLAVNDMFLTGQERVKSFFLEDVNRFLEANQIRFTPTIAFTGKSGFVHKFDFVIPHSRSQPERILKAINRASRETVSSLIFAWNDTKDARPTDSRAYAVLNDLEKEVSSEFLSALEKYEIQSVLWRQRNDFVPQLVA